MAAQRWYRGSSSSRTFEEQSAATDLDAVQHGHLEALFDNVSGTEMQFEKDDLKAYLIGASVHPHLTLNRAFRLP